MNISISVACHRTVRSRDVFVFTMYYYDVPYLLGQFWGVPFKLVPTSGHNYNITMYPPGAARNRTMFAFVHENTWSQMGVPAIPSSSSLFVGTSQAGPFPSDSDSVIEGTWEDYRTDSLFNTTWTYTRYKEQICGTYECLLHTA